MDRVLIACAACTHACTSRHEATEASPCLHPERGMQQGRLGPYAALSVPLSPHAPSPSPARAPPPPPNATRTLLVPRVQYATLRSSLLNGLVAPPPTAAAITRALEYALTPSLRTVDIGYYITEVMV